MLNCQISYWRRRLRPTKIIKTSFVIRNHINSTFNINFGIHFEITNRNQNCMYWYRLILIRRKLQFEFCLRCLLFHMVTSESVSFLFSMFATYDWNLGWVSWLAKDIQIQTSEYCTFFLFYFDCSENIIFNICCKKIIGLWPVRDK